MTASRLIDNLQKMFDEAWEQNMSGNGTDLSRMVTTFVPMAIQELSAEEKHGRWIKHNNKIICSHCKEEPVYANLEGFILTKRCPNCGADMRGESE